MVYVIVIFLQSGTHDWHHLDFVFGNNILWGDDAYRYFLIRSLPHNVDLWWFSFMAPGQLIIDRLMLWLVHDGLYPARLLRAVCYLLSCGLFLACMVQLGVRRPLAFAMAFLLAVFPLTFFVSISFYGESWLVFFIFLSLYLFLKGKLFASFCVVSMLPLLRPEGILFVAPVVLWALVQKRWWLAAIPVTPGFIYLLMILFAGPGLDTYFAWREFVKLVYFQAETWYGILDLRLLHLLFPPFVVFAIAAWCLPVLRATWPFVVGSAAFLGFSLALLVTGKVAFEPRYFIGAFPMLFLGFAVMLEHLMRCSMPRQHRASLVGTLLVVAFLWAGSTSSLVGCAVKEIWRGKEHPMCPMVTSVEQREALQKLGSVLSEMTHVNTDIHALVIGPKRLFYLVDPLAFPDRVQVVWPLSSWGGLHAVLKRDATIGYFSTQPYAAVFSMSLPKEGEPQLLYVDDMGLENYPFHWSVAAESIYLFGSRQLFGATAVTQWQDE